MPRVIGLTGNIASGKTSVGHMLLELGAERYIDADAVVHRLYKRGQPIALQIAREFGATMMTAEGDVDRKELGNVVFRDIAAMRRLEHIVHPAVGIVLKQELASFTSSAIVIIDAVKLLEGESGKLCQSKWLVICPQEQQLARLMARNGLSEEEAYARIRAQPSVAAKIALVDEVIDNGGSLDDTRHQVETAFTRFCKKFPA